MNTSDKYGAFFKIVSALIMIFSIAFFSCGGHSGNEETVVIGMEATAVNSLIYIAENRGYFSDSGLRVILKDKYASGFAAAEGILKGEADIATASETVIVRHAIEGKKILALCSIDRFMHQYLVCRKDRDITTIPDITGKRIGLPMKTAAQFNFSRFLKINSIAEKDVRIIDVQAPKALSALLDGKVDAVVAWQPNIISINERLGDKVSLWSVQNGQPTYCAVITTADWAKKHPKPANRFLASLSRAEDYLLKNSGRAMVILQKRLKYKDAYMKAIWQEHQFSLSLEQSLITAMEDQARWMIKNNLAAGKAVPDFMTYISEDSLKTVKPEIIDFIR